MLTPNSLPWLRMTRGILFLAAAMFIAMPPVANGQITTREKRVLQQNITKAKAVAVDPARINTVPVDIAAANQPAASEVPRDLPAAAADVAVVATPQLDSPAASFVSRVNAGELLFVPLNAETELNARNLLAEKVSDVAGTTMGTLASFDGAIRQLASDQTEVQLKSAVLVGQRLQYDASSQQFVGTVLIGVTDLFGDGTQRALTVPMRFEVLESAHVDPREVALDTTSPPYRTIRVTSKVIGQPVTLHFASNFARDPVSLQVPVEPTLMVDVDGDRLRALGMQTTRVTVRAVGSLPPENSAVSIRAPGAFLTDLDPPVFDQHGVARATLRTDSPGTVLVTAVANGFAPGTALPVTVIWPWPTLAATILGGFIGGFVRLARRIRRGMNVGQYLIALLVSIFVGVIVFALYVVGVKLLPVEFSVQVGDLFAFAAAALAGWLGTGLLPQLASRT